jgi:hypothetical protein
MTTDRMTTAHLRLAEGGRPLVAAVCSVPLVGEAVRSALEFAEVRIFTGQRDTAGLLRSLKPDVVIVDSDPDADEASAYAAETDVSVLQISIRDRSLRLFRNGEWEQVGDGEGPTPEAVRNVVAGTLFSRRGPSA